MDPKITAELRRKYQGLQINQFKKFMAHIHKTDPNSISAERARRNIKFSDQLWLGKSFKSLLKEGKEVLKDLNREHVGIHISRALKPKVDMESYYEHSIKLMNRSDIYN